MTPTAQTSAPAVPSSPPRPPGELDPRLPRLALGPRAGLALARHDLERDVEPVPLVAGEPDRPGAPAPERAQRPVAPEDERGRGDGGSVCHPRCFGRARRKSFG